MSQETDPTGQGQTPRWLVWAQIITALLTFLGTFGLSVTGNASAPFAIAGAAMLLLFRFGDLSSLSFESPWAKGALNAYRRETRRTSQVRVEAEQTIEALRLLGMNLSKTVLTLQALQGRQDAWVSFRGRLAARDAIVSDLENLGLSAAEAQLAASTFDDFVVNDLIARALHFAPEGRGKEMLSSELNSSSLPLPRVDEVREMFRVKDCLTPDTENFLTEAERYQDTKQVDLSKIY